MGTTIINKFNYRIVVIVKVNINVWADVMLLISVMITVTEKKIDISRLMIRYPNSI